MVGMVHSTESFGSADGPGVRFVVFLQGCAMRCRYCHNPDTWRREGGTPMTADEILDQAERYRAYWGSDGGITVSGGEALLQAEFVAELFERAHARGINTCLDTALQPYRDDPAFISTFDRLLENCDVVLADIKHIDPAAHRSLTGHDNANILAGIRHVASRSVPIWIRYVLVPGVTDDPNDLRRAADFIRSVPTVERVDVLPYHTLGVYKWDELGIPYTLRDVDPPTAEAVASAEKILCMPSSAQKKGGRQ
ncbi:MAG: pyruvate formate-lyase-activating protein [Tractidigestivibacter sp.]|jgi:pyruvate formate lyase activating enzyme|uniref:pyruvate formate-lyase-activating protein n=1 Tax=Tractidigestivibacter sp. TaxID=2847320 RepID=UPI003D93F7C7